MNVFEAVKETVTTRQAAEAYGIPVRRNGMCLCPFHNDKNPSMKVDQRFHCFGCQVDGDVIDFTAKLFGLTVKEAALKLAADFGVSYDARGHDPPVKKPVKPKIRDELRQRQAEQRCFRIYAGYLHLLEDWKERYAPKPEDADWNPLFVEALQKRDYVEYLLDTLLFGSSMYTGSLQKAETNRFARADLEYKLVFVDDDMKTEALPQTNNIKTIVTLEDKIDIERKGVQSVQGTLYSRFACFGNGSLHALHDKSNGFYRRQLLLTTREQPADRKDDPFLIDKLRTERDGIFLWALEGLHRLIKNNYQFTISQRTADNLEAAMEQGNNILAFLKSEGWFEVKTGTKCKSTYFYKVYVRWCQDNLEKPFAAATFIHHLRDHQKSLGITYDDKCIGTNRGFHNVDLNPFVPVDAPCPWD